MSFKWNNRGLNVFKEQMLVKALNKCAYDTLNDISNSNVVPYDTGNLQEDSSSVEKATLTNKKSFMKWSAVYARRLYYHPEYNFQKGRKGRWADEWIFGSKKKRVLKSYEDAAKEVLR